MAPSEPSGKLRRPTRRGNAPAAKPVVSSAMFDIPDDEAGLDAPNSKESPRTKPARRGRPKGRTARGKVTKTKSRPDASSRQRKAPSPKPQAKATPSVHIDRRGTEGEDDDRGQSPSLFVQDEPEMEVDGNVGDLEPEVEVDEMDEGEEEEEPLWSENDLVGHSRVWNDVLRERRRLEDQLSEHPDIGIRSSEFKQFNRIVRKAKKCYRSIMGDESTETATEDLKIRCDELKSKLYLIKESIVRSLKGVAAYDMYAFAIPEFIDLVELAFETRLRPFPGKEKLAELSEVITILEIGVELCSKARKWETAPSPNIYIMRHTQRVFLPKLRNILEGFQTVYKSLTQELRAEQDAAKRSSYYDKEAAKREEESKARWILIKENRAGIRSDIARIPDPFLSQRPRSRTPSVQPTQNPQTAKDEWTEEQDDEMMRKLAQSHELELEMRYAACLTCPSLQNKLPQHIEHRAMELKTDIIRYYEELDDEEPDIAKRKGVPSWVTSLGYCTINGAA